MDIATLEGLIGNLGFSLVACCAMAFFIWKILDKFFTFANGVSSTLKDVTDTNKELSSTNKMLVENFREDMGTMKRDIQDIKEIVKR